MDEDLIAFMRAMLTVDEQAALDAEGAQWGDGCPEQVHDDHDPVGCWIIQHLPRTGEIVVSDSGTMRPVDAHHIVLHDPARALEDAVAKRQIVDAFEHRLGLAQQYRDRVNIAVLTELRRVVQLLARAHASHPDYRPEWRP
jgi:hypothetical protein